MMYLLGVMHMMCDDFVCKYCMIPLASGSVPVGDVILLAACQRPPSCHVVVPYLSAIAESSEG